VGSINDKPGSLTVTGCISRSFQDPESPALQFANLQCEWARVIRGLEALQQVEATFQDKRFVLRSQLTSEASAALRATGVAAPPTLREVS
jgi:hypothetical protein